MFLGFKKNAQIVYKTLLCKGYKLQSVEVCQVVSTQRVSYQHCVSTNTAVMWLAGSDSQFCCC